MQTRLTDKILKRVQNDINDKIHDNKSHQLFYGASNGLNFEPWVNDIVKFAHLCLHDEDAIEQVKEFLINCNNQE